jgi:hypothetical protein
MPCAINKDECRCVSNLYHHIVSIANPCSWAWAVQRISGFAPLQNFVEKRPQKPKIVMIEAERSEAVFGTEQRELAGYGEGEGATQHFWVF